MPLYQFHCGEHLTERIAPMGTESIECSCGKPAPRQTVYRSSFVVEPAEVPPDQQRHDLRLFREASEERAYYHNRAEDRAQRELPSRPLWQMARRRAEAVMAGKAPPPSGRS